METGRISKERILRGGEEKGVLVKCLTRGDGERKEDEEGIMLSSDRVWGGVKTIVYSYLREGKIASSCR